mgnify:CR=1 FL=1
MLRLVEEALTFDDVLLLPGYSECVSADVSLKTRLTKDIDLNIPLVSASMDTVTEYALAIALAQAGGIGVIHKNMNVERQAEQVRIEGDAKAEYLYLRAVSSGIKAFHDYKTYA